MTEVILHAVKHSMSLYPFLFVTYLVMEMIQRAAGEKTHEIIREAGRVGPVWGSLCGAFPQCGFSAAASYFYVGRVITLGTLLSIYMSTSDEMLPILISEKIAPSVIVKIILTKVLIGMVSGFVIDFFISWLGKRDRMPKDIAEHNSTEYCCAHHGGPVKDAFFHSVQIWFFILLISIAIGAAVHFIGRDTLSSFFSDVPVLGEIIAGLVGLIPNCGASVVITQLYIDGIIGTGPMMSGLLVSAGVGLLVLFKENHHVSENALIVAILYVVSIVWGVLFDVIGISF